MNGRWDLALVAFWAGVIAFCVTLEVEVALLIVHHV